MAEYDELEIDLNEADEAGSFEPAPVGTHLCRLEVEPLASIGNQGNLGFRMRGVVVEPNNYGRIVEDVLFTSRQAMPRLIKALHQIGGIEKNAEGEWPKLKAREMRDLLDGKVGRLTVEKVVYQKKGDKTEYTESQAATFRANGEKVYGHAKVSFAGYDAATSEDLTRHASTNGAKTRERERLPF